MSNESPPKTAPTNGMRVNVVLPKSVADRALAHQCPGEPFAGTIRRLVVKALDDLDASKQVRP
jgi:hypothetical protein